MHVKKLKDDLETLRGKALAGFLALEITSPEQNRRFAERFLLYWQQFRSPGQHADAIVAALRLAIFSVNAHALFEEKLCALLHQEPAVAADVVKRVKAARAALNNFFNDVMLRVFRKGFRSEKLALLVLDYFLKSGNSEAFQYCINQCILTFPRKLVFWNLAINRLVDLGDYLGAINLCQKCLASNSDDADVSEMLNRLSLAVEITTRVRIA